MTEFWRWTATQMAAAVASGEVSSRELVTSCLERIDATNPHLNALVEVREEEALAQADEADRRRAAGEPLGTLHGVPVSTKINVNQVGYPTTQGVTAFRDDFPTQDDPHIAAFRRAGAVLLGRSNSPSFAYRWVTDNDLHGRTLNPWDVTRSPGGSSGGAAASVAVGMLPISQGNDIGGSVRYPAFACGVVGFRPSVGMVAHHPEPEPTDMRLSVQIMAVEGPLTRTVADARLTLTAWTTHTPEDNVDPEWVPDAPVAPPARHPRRVGLVRRVGVDKQGTAVDAALDAAADALRAEGYEVEEIDVPQLHDAYRLWYLLAMEEFRALQPRFNELAGDGMRICAENYMAVATEWWGERPSLDDFISGYARRGTLQRSLAVLMRDYPILLMPVSSEQACEQDADIQSVERMARLMDANASMMAVPVLGLPAVSVPTGVHDGLPTGVQLLGRRFDDLRLLEAAAGVEKHLGTITPL